MSTPKEALTKAIQIVGSKSALARELKITPWALSKWNFEKIPEARCLPIEKITDGKVTAEELRPDINWMYIRALKNSMRVMT
ncbi:TPA: helix-turn-helix domain-containing protein [Acinetobacter baumannii]|uniref:transcriptional regulator n=1 Tax=Acinetobacter baumannii TaxID=470 RepID=UPI002293007B|nr:helix-turn-helix domain-containing protein [Acinetobacter baumannii]MDC4754186.1 helix-turn-helix domain-containing protein [Acinetobacter baumannii]MDC5112842.1 helix-turn-helix domain-containing protein [Acinetobacter baumannii]MDC5127052.1 helix-turn-helix domain-containing protein [Acinetobacter baumannii]MDC5370295.1 helix-turn-helix domain-containing protein [Acinetobacter baumannii]